MIFYLVFFTAADGNYPAVAHGEGLIIHAGDGLHIDDDTMIALAEAGIHQ